MTTVLNGTVTPQIVDQYARQGYNILHFAGHSNEHFVQLSNGTHLEADDIVRYAHMAGASLIVFNSCLSSRLGAYAVSHGITYVICSTIELDEPVAWEFPSAFYVELDNGSWPDIYKAFRVADSSNGEYAILIAPVLYTDCDEQLIALRARTIGTFIVQPRTVFFITTLTIFVLFSFAILLIAFSGRSLF